MPVRSAVCAWLGLVVVAASGLLAGCGGDKTPVTAENSKFRPTDAKKIEADVGLPPAEVPEGLPGQRNTTPVDQGSDITPPKSPSVKPGANEVAKTTAKDPVENPAATGSAPTKGGKEIVVTAEVAKLQQTIQQLLRTRPPGNTQEELEANLRQQMYVIVELSSRLLQANAPPELHEFALDAADQALQLLLQIRDASAVTRRANFAATLAKHPNADLARTGRVMGFGATIGPKLDAPEVNAAEILKEVESLLSSDSGDAQVLMLTNQVCQMLGQKGFKTEAAQGLRAIAAAYKDHKNPQLAAAAVTQEHAAILLEADVRTLLKDVVQKKPDAEAKLLAAVQELLKDKNPTTDYVQALIDVTQELERVGNDTLVVKFYDLLEEKYGAHEDPEFAKLITKYVTTGRKRYGLIGKPFGVNAVSFEEVGKAGTPFDLKSTKGKVLLVSCWGTFVGPAFRELPTLKQIAEKFRPNGLEVVSLMFDVDLGQPQKMLEYQKNFIPWTTYVSPDVASGKKFEDSQWNETSLAQDLGLFSLPLYILVDKEGNVDSIFHYRLESERLAERLKELLGLPEVPKLTEPPPPLTIENTTIPKAAPIPNDAPPPPAVAAPAEPPKPEAPAVPAPAPPKQSRTLPDLRQLDRQLAAIFSPAGLFSVLAADDEPAKEAEANPYLAKPGLSSSQLTDWIFKMLDKPKTIQGRPGFSAAIVEACDRILADKTAKETEQLVAIENKLGVLHRAACNGDDKADKQLAEFVAQLKDDARPRVARETAFFQQERKVLDASEAKPEELAALLKELQEYYAKEKLASKHLRMASATVDLINKLADGDAREKHFAEFGNVFAKSSDKELARYGKKLAKKPETKESDLVGKPLELAGNLAGGLPFAWEKYRGKVVIVDFWATWCGPCRKEMPNVKALREKHKDKGLEVVGVSVDKDLDALDAYLEENDIPWETLAGDEASALAEKYGVRGIPTMMLVDQKGIVVAVAHNVAALTPQAEKLLAK